MGIVLAFSALSIDIATWYQKHHQSQVAADAATLAAANCLANASSTNPGDACTSTTDTTDAASVATQIAAANGVSIPTSNVSFNGSTVTVTTPSPTPTLFAAALGVHTSTRTATAAADWVPATSSACTASQQSAGKCFLIFAMDQTCNDKSLDITGGVATLNGAVHTNGSFDMTGGVYSFDAPVTYGNASGCGYGFTGGVPTYNDGAPAPESAITTWPTNYATDFPACSSGGTVTCTGPCSVTTTPCPAGDSTPSYCTYASTQDYNFSNAAPANGVWCAVGNQGTASNPATWNGKISVTGGNGTGTASVTFIGGNVSLTGGTYNFSAYEHNLFAYATTGTATLTGGNITWTGDVFDPSGTIDITGGNASTTTFLEGHEVTMTGGNFTGDGPTSIGSSSTASASDFLIQ